MKRAAEKQLVKDQEDDGDDEADVESPGSGFKKASETVLAKREIRGLPRRSLAAGASSVPPPSSTSTSELTAASKSRVFAGHQFSGGFSLGPLPAPSFFSSSGTSSTSAQPSLLSEGPSIASSASAATKAFASIVSSSSAPDEPKASAADPDQSEVEYYKALRGLNASFLSAVSKAIESDPFVDVADLLERYKALRISVKSGLDEKPKTTPNASASSSTTTAPEASKPASAPSFAMPAAPSGFAGFKPLASTTSSTTPPGGFVPKVDSSSASTLGSPFSFAPPKPATSETSSEASKSPFTFGSSSSSNTSTTAPTSAFSFGAPSSTSSNAFSFGKSSVTPSTSAPSLFGSGSSAPSTSLFGSSSNSSPSLFGGSTFGASTAPKDTTKDKDAGKDKEADKPAPVSFFGTSGSSSFNPFSGTSSTSGTTTNTTPEKDKDSKPFSFGSASPGKPSFFGTPAAGSVFGSKAGSIGNPVGFGFGSPPKTPDADGGKDGPVKSLPFSFAPLKPASASASASVFGDSGASAGESESKAGPSSGEGTPAPGEAGDQPPPPLLASSSVHDQEGEGEEDEVTVHEIRSKVYKMTKDKEGKAQWGDLGVGVLRLKKHKETGARRVLLRNSGTGKITINFLIHSGMNTTVSDKAVSFMGHEAGVSTPYRIRVKTADQANDLKAALDREIEFVKGKTE